VCVVLATGPGNLPAVWVWTARMGQFGSRPVQKPDQQLLGTPNQEPYPSTCRLCWVWLDASVPITGSGYLVCIWMVALRYPTVNRNILTLGRHCSCSMLWPPIYSIKRDPRSLHNFDNMSPRSVNHSSPCIFGNLSGDWLQPFINEVQAAFIVQRESDTLPARIWKWA